MERKHNKKLLSSARNLRKSMTDEEKHLWYDFLRTYPIKFTRQKILGRYIADFYCAKAKLIVELDGSGHYTKDGKEYDISRTAFLEGYGLTVLKFQNFEIHNNFEGVCRYIDREVRKRTDNN
jgi:very-short-patch-repair endonuclease